MLEFAGWLLDQLDQGAHIYEYGPGYLQLEMSDGILEYDLSENELALLEFMRDYGEFDEDED